MSNERTPKPPTKIEAAFYAAVCQDRIPLAVCRCGTTHAGNGAETAAENLIRHPEIHVEAGVFLGENYVAGCDCDCAQAVANIVWQNRQDIVGFLRRFTETLEFSARESRSLVESLPASITGK